MTKKLFGILIIIIGIIAIVALVYFMFFFNSSPSEEINLPPASPVEQQPVVPSATSTPSEKTTINLKPESVISREVGEEDLKRIAASFAERFGSFSNQSDYGNIRDLVIFMSPTMKTWANNHIEEEIAKKTDSNIYYGVSTKAVSENVKQFDETAGRAEILISTQRREAVGAAHNATAFQQDILISFVKVKGIWKVDSALWQDR